jgi:hypothetical protein
MAVARKVYLLVEEFAGGATVAVGPFADNEAARDFADEHEVERWYGTVVGVVPLPVETRSFVLKAIAAAKRAEKEA